MSPGWRKFVAYILGMAALITLAAFDADSEYGFAAVGMLAAFVGGNGLEWLARARKGVL